MSGDCYERTGPCPICGRDTTGGSCVCVTILRCPDCDRELIGDVCGACALHEHNRAIARREMDSLHHIAELNKRLAESR